MSSNNNYYARVRKLLKERNISWSSIDPVASQEIMLEGMKDGSVKIIRWDESLYGKAPSIEELDAYTKEEEEQENNESMIEHELKGCKSIPVFTDSEITRYMRLFRPGTLVFNSTTGNLNVMNKDREIISV